MSAAKKTLTDLQEKLRKAPNANLDPATAALQRDEKAPETVVEPGEQEEIKIDESGASEPEERVEKPKVRTSSRSRNQNGSDEARFERVSGVLFSEVEIMDELKDVIREECGVFPNTAQAIRVAFKLAKREMTKRTVVKGLFEETRADDKRRKKKRK